VSNENTVNALKSTTMTRSKDFRWQ